MLVLEVVPTTRLVLDKVRKAKRGRHVGYRDGDFVLAGDKFSLRVRYTDSDSFAQRVHRILDLIEERNLLLDLTDLQEFRVMEINGVSVAYPASASLGTIERYIIKNAKKGEQFIVYYAPFEPEDTVLPDAFVISEKLAGLRKRLGEDLILYKRR